MSSSIYKLIEEATNEKVNPRITEFAKARGLVLDGDGEDGITTKDALSQLNEAEEFMYAQFTGRDFKGERVTVPGVEIKEALTSSDASIIFPRVISEVLLEPTEPNLFLTNSVADTMELADDAPLTIEFPVVTALNADYISEGQEYPADVPGFEQFMTSIRLRKIGIQTSVTEEVINRSMWPIVKIQLRMMAAAINRKVESTLFQILTNKSQNVFDNENSDSDYRTTGKATDQSWNGTFSYFDLVKMAGVLLGNKFGATHFLAHPLAWPIFAQDPIMRAQFYNGGQLGNTIWKTMPQFDQSVNFPFGIAYVPYYALPYTENDTLTGAGSGLGASLTTDVYMIDAQNSLFLATRGPIEMDQMENWFRDAKMMKAKKYVGASAKNGGKGMVSAKNIRVVRNDEAIMTINTVTV